MDEIEVMIRDRSPLKLLIDRVSIIDPASLPQDQQIHLAFTCARINKLTSSKFKPSNSALHAIVEEAAFRINLDQEPPANISKLFWACASVDVRPFIPPGLSKQLLNHDMSDKEFCTIIWALSKFVLPEDPDGRLVFEELIASLSEDRADRLSNDDVVNLLRSMSQFYLR